ncbi:MAG TPA: CoA-transferase, partial [Desulfobacteraceae bacterium]|nr:CoA-transferase [Desulfobacteraceae bacterium]
QSDAKIPNDKLIQMDNPFSTSNNTDRLVLVPAINPDVTIIHVQKADKKGNCRIEGLSFADVEQAKAARHLIVTCEQLYTGDELKRNSDQNQIPFIHVDAVVHMPHGAYPTACYNSYDYDPRQLKMYARCAKDEEAFNNYLEQYVLGTRDHGALMELVGREQIEKITADPETGYASNLDRT